MYLVFQMKLCMKGTRHFQLQSAHFMCKSELMELELVSYHCLR